MIEGQTKHPEGAESVRALAYDFRFPIETFYRACCNPQMEFIKHNNGVGSQLPDHLGIRLPHITADPLEGHLQPRAIVWSPGHRP